MARRPGINLLRPSENDVTKSQLFPILTMAPELAGKGFLVPAITTVVCGIAGSLSWDLYGATGLGRVLAVYFALLAFYVVYAMCGKRMPWWCFVGVSLFTAGLMETVLPQLIDGIDALVHLFGLHNLQGAGLLVSLPFWVVRAGLFEEFVKIIPVALLAYLAIWLDTHPPTPRAHLRGAQYQTKLRPWLTTLAVREPLDGILFAVASASVFLLLETLQLYGPMAYALTEKHLTELIKNDSDIAGLYEAIKNGSAAISTQVNKAGLDKLITLAGLAVDKKAELDSLQVVLQRTLMSPFAHTAWSGIAGYGIGLALLRPKAALKIIAICVATAAGLHGLFDAVASAKMGDTDKLLFEGAVELSSYAILASMILKARQLSPTRASNFATTFLPQAAFELRLGTQRIPLRLGARLTAADIAHHGPGIVPDAPIAEVTHSPQSPRILGLKNLSQMTWHATLPDKRSIEVPPGNSMRLVGQCRIRFGTVEGVVA